MKTLGGRCSVAVLFALPQQGLPAADKAAVSSHLSSGTELRSRGVSEHLPSYVLGRSGLTRGYHRTFSLTPRAVISSRQPAIIAGYSHENRRLLHSRNDTESIDTEQV